MDGRRVHRQERHHLQPEHPDRGSLHHAACKARRGPCAATKPLSYQGTLIDDISVRFEGGRIVEAKASKGEDVLNKVLDTDEGARRLGEVALVPHSSPISTSGLLFFNTLFDENAACHIALGQCYSKCFVDGAKLTPGRDRSARRQQEPHPHRLDDRLGQDRHRRRQQRRPQGAGDAQGRVGLSRPRLIVRAASMRSRAGAFLAVQRALGSAW